MMNLHEYVSYHSKMKDVTIMKIVSSVVSQLVTARHKKNLSTEEFAEYLGIPEKLLIEWESCDYIFTLYEISYIADRLNLDCDLVWCNIFSNKDV